MQPQARGTKRPLLISTLPFLYGDAASRWHGGVARPEGAVRCKGSGHGQPRAGPPSLGCGHRGSDRNRDTTPGPPPRQAQQGVVDQGWSPGLSHSLREDPVHPGAAGSPGGYLLGESPGRPIVLSAQEASLTSTAHQEDQAKTQGPDCQKNTHSLADRKHHNSKPE